MTQPDTEYDTRHENVPRNQEQTDPDPEDDEERRKRLEETEDEEQEVPAQAFCAPSFTSSKVFQSRSSREMDVLSKAPDSWADIGVATVNCKKNCPMKKPQTMTA
jgi:hypothetical protein